jgi:PIN domain nuclease of toxin-antitoxin system
VILLDTHVVIWLALSPELISSRAKAAIGNAESSGAILGISVMTLYEIANTIRRGRIQPSVPHEVFLRRIGSRFNVIPVTEVIAVRAAAIPAPFHGDPMDRIIAATTVIERATLITADRRIHTANVCEVLW